jgi:hypothetical protein
MGLIRNRLIIKAFLGVCLCRTGCLAALIGLAAPLKNYHGLTNPSTSISIADFPSNQLFVECVSADLEIHDQLSYFASLDRLPDSHSGVFQFFSYHFPASNPTV